MYPILRTFSFLTVLICSINNSSKIFAQENDTLSRSVLSQDYFNYSNWSIHFNKTFYKPGSAEKTTGVYNIHPQLMHGYNFGFRYTIKKEKPISYYSGFDIEWVPFYNFYFSVAAKEIISAPNFYEAGFENKSKLQVVGSLPIGMAWKHKISKYAKSGGVYLHIKSDVRFHLMQNKLVGFSYISDGVYFFNFNYYPTTQYNLSPSLNVAAGMDFITKIALFTINLNVQKGWSPFMKAAYEFKQLQLSPNTKGTYSFMADYIGIDVGIHFKR